MSARPVDKPFLILTLILLTVGFFIFASASLGLLARENITFSAVAINQLVSVGIGLVVLVIVSRTPFRFWNKGAFYFFLLSLAATALVFIPGLGFSHGGATRWLALGALSFQPAELLKFAFIIYWSAWLAGVQRKVQHWQFSVLPFVILLVLIAGILIAQPDIGTLLVIATTGFALLIAGGGLWRHTAALAGTTGVLLLSLGAFVPYIQRRLLTFLDPSSDPLGAGYQIQQSLIAIGSGKFFGRGFGQSVQKFNFLPEPIGDSIFAVFAEEWGFIGALLLLGLFTAFILRGIRIAQRAPTRFALLTVTGIITLIAVQSFINIGSMLGVFPLTGMPLLFVSQGGSALIVTLAMVGVVLNISRFQRKV